MKTLKLEVGKTYRSRKGKEVRIVVKDVGIYAYQGIDLEWYTENGRYTYSGPEHPLDLIEEVTRHAFAIPEGVKQVTVEQVGNCIASEMVPEKEPKPGDVMINDRGSVYIFQAVVDNFNHKHYAWFRKDGCLVIDSMCVPGRPATTEEAQPLFDALKKAGKRWNAETMKVEEIPESTRIREWMDMNIKCGGEVVDIAEVIERYLKYREGEK